MAYSYGRKYYKKKYGNKSYGRKKYYRKASLYKQVRALNSGTSSTLVQVTRSGMIGFRFAANSNVSNVLTVCPWGASEFNYIIWCSAVASPLYQTYSSLFDEVRLERMEVTIAPAKSLVSGSATLMMYSALDRKFVKDDTVQTVAKLTQASGVIARNIQPASTIPFKRVAYARDLQERTTYYDSSWNKRTVTSEQIDITQLKAWSNGGNAFAGFSPAFSFGMLATTAPTTEQTIAFVLTVKYYLRFRNPKTDIDAGSVPVIDNGGSINSTRQTNAIADLNLNPLHNDVVVEESKDADSTVK